jgi:tRNA A37 N6-isopentenylltransferase MiaA
MTLAGDLIIMADQDAYILKNKITLSMNEMCSERSIEEVTAKVTKALTEVQKNDFQECFQKLAQVCY